MKKLLVQKFLLLTSAVLLVMFVRNWHQDSKSSFLMNEPSTHQSLNNKRILASQRKEKVCSYKKPEDQAESTFGSYKEQVEEMINNSGNDEASRHFDEYLKTQNQEDFNKYGNAIIPQPFIITLLVFLLLAVVGSFSCFCCYLCTCCNCQKCLKCFSCCTPNESYSKGQKCFAGLGLIVFLIFTLVVSIGGYITNAEMNDSFNTSQCEVYKFVGGALDGEKTVVSDEEFKQILAQRSNSWMGLVDIINKIYLIADAVEASPNEISEEFGGDNGWIDTDYDGLNKQIDDIYSASETQVLTNPNPNNDTKIQLKQYFGPKQTKESVTGLLWQELNVAIGEIKKIVKSVSEIATEMKTQADALASNIRSVNLDLVTLTIDLKSLEESMDRDLSPLDDSQQYFHNSLLGFFGFAILIMLLGVIGVILSLCKGKCLGKFLTTLSWCLIMLTMILTLVISVFLNIGVEVLIDGCRVIQKGFKNETYYKDVIVPQLNNPPVTDLIYTCVYGDGDIVKLYNIDQDIARISNISPQTRELEQLSKNASEKSVVTPEIFAYYENVLAFKKAPWEVLVNVSEEVKLQQYPYKEIRYLTALTDDETNDSFITNECSNIQDQWVLDDLTCKTDYTKDPTNPVGTKTCLNIKADQTSLSRYPASCSQAAADISKRVLRLDSYSSDIQVEYNAQKLNLNQYESDLNAFNAKLWAKFEPIFAFESKLQGTVNQTTEVINGVNCRFFGDQAIRTTNEFCGNFVVAWKSVSIWTGALGIILTIGSLFAFLSSRWFREGKEGGRSDKYRG